MEKGQFIPEGAADFRMVKSATTTPFPTAETTAEPAAEPKKDIPSWNESILALQPEQLFSAELAFTTKMLKKFDEDSDNSKAFYRLIARGQDIHALSDDVVRTYHIQSLFAQYIDHLSGQEDLDATSIEARHVSSRMEELLPEIELLRDETFNDARNWNSGKARRTRREAHSLFTSLPDGLQDYFYEQTGLPKETLEQKTLRQGITIGANVGSAVVLDVVAVTAGALAVKYNILQLDDKSREAAIAALVASYVPLIGAFKAGVEENYLQLTENDVNASVLSKALYTWMKSKTDNEKMHKIAAGLGYVAYDLAGEVPYYAAAIAANKLLDSHNAEIAFLAGANLGGAGVEYAKARISRALRTFNDGKVHKDIAPNVTTQAVTPATLGTSSSQ